MIGHDGALLPMLGGTLLASILGSLHCAGMCGPLAVIACGARSGQPKSVPLTAHGRALGGSRWTHDRTAHLLYHALRGVSYAGVGAAAGALGSLAGVSGTVSGVQRVAMLVAGTALVVAGLGALGAWRGLGRSWLPARVHATLARWHAWVLTRGAFARALLLGAGAPLLPCGWLWAFVAVAATTGSAGAGAAVMGAFWLGTIPALVGVVLGTRVLLTRGIGAGAARWMKPAMGVALIAIGLDMGLTRSSTAPAVMDAAQRAAASTSTDTALSEAQESVPACCREQPDDTAQEPKP